MVSLKLRKQRIQTISFLGSILVRSIVLEKKNSIDKTVQKKSINWICWIAEDGSNHKKTTENVFFFLYYPFSNIVALTFSVCGDVSLKLLQNVTM